MTSIFEDSSSHGQRLISTLSSGDITKPGPNLEQQEQIDKVLGGSGALATGDTGGVTAVVPAPLPPLNPYGRDQHDGYFMQLI